MLILTLNPGDRVYIDDDIVISYPKKHGVNYGQISLGFDAPKEMRILREKVRLKNLQRMHDANNSTI